MKQIDPKDCALVNLEYFYKKFFRKKLDLIKLKNMVHYSQSGITLSELERVASFANIAFEVFNCNFDQLKSINKDELPLSIIISDGEIQHMVILKKIKSNLVYYFDPIKGNVRVKESEFKNKFLRLVLNFYPIKNNVKSNILNKKEFVYNINLTYLFFRVISTLVIFIIPFLSKVFISEFTQNYDLVNLSLIFLLYSWLVFISFLIKRISFNLLNRAILGKFKQKRSQVWKYLFFDDKNIKFKYSSQKINDKINSYIIILKFEQQFFAEIFINVISILFLSIFLFFINNILLISILIFAFVYLVISITIYVYQYKNKASFNEILISEATLQDDLANLLRNSSTDEFKNFMLTKESQSIDKLIKSQNKINDSNNHILDLSEYLNIVFPLLLILIGVIQLWNNKVNLNELIFFITCSNFIFNPIKSTCVILNDYIDYKNSLFKFGVLSEALCNNKTSKNYLNQKINRILIRDITVKFMGKNKLKIHNLLIDKNVIITGKNGSGKSLLCKLICNIVSSESGQVLINNTNIERIDNIASKVYLLTNEEYFANLTVKEYLFNLKHYDPKVLKRFKKYDFNSILKFYDLDYSKLILNNATNLSTGQKRILSVIKLFTFNPDVIIFDEFFENMDIKITNYIKEIIKEEFKSCIFIEISHNQNYLFNDSQRINIEKLNLI